MNDLVMDQNEFSRRLEDILFSRSRIDLRNFNDNFRFVHYGTLDTIYNIISNEEIWLRNVGLMNDYGEINYAIEYLTQHFGAINRRNTPPDEQFISLWENGRDGIAEISWPDAWALYCSELKFIKRHTFAFCLSEHDEEENLLGRLSMWRAYGSPRGGALVLNAREFAKLVADHALLGKMQYVRSHNEFMGDMYRNIRSLYPNKFSSNKVAQDLFVNFLTHYTQLIKHPGFLEEKEWRIIFNSSVTNTCISMEREVKGGIPQIIAKLKFAKLSSYNGLSRIISRIIIGPSPAPNESREALIELLESKGIKDAGSMIHISNIPIRERQ